MEKTIDNRNKELRKQKGYKDTIADLVFIKESTPLQIYERFCGKNRTWSQRQSERLAKEDFKNDQRQTQGTAG